MKLSISSLSRSRRFAASLVLVGIASGIAPLFAADSPESLREEITALQPPALVWREIDWNYCLLDGIAKSREEKKPILLWSFINSDPAEERC